MIIEQELSKSKNISHHFIKYVLIIIQLTRLLIWPSIFEFFIVFFPLSDLKLI